jgi:hypothetical protein
LGEAPARRLWARLTWQAADPEALAADVARRLGIGAAPHAWQDGALAIALGNATLEVVPWRPESPSDDPLPGGRLVFEGVPGGLAQPAPTELPPLVLAGVGWATVDLDRAEAELAEWLAGDAPDPATDAAETILGARARRRAADGLPGAELALLEPSTEGRVAASLARDGEGPCGLYIRPAGGLAAWTAVARDRGVGTSTIGDGPYGPSLLVLGGPVAGPHLLIVDRPAGTIRA